MMIIKNAHRKWVDSAIKDDTVKVKDDKWTHSIAVGSEQFIEKIKKCLGFRVKGRKIVQTGGAFMLREKRVPYGIEADADIGSTFLWNGISNPFS